MTTGYTPGPWQYNGPSSIFADDRLITIGYSGFHWAGLATRALREANTRRIVACVNACANLATERLEAIANGERPETLEETAYVYHARKERDSARAIIDNLLLTLEDISADGCFMPEDGEPCGSCGACVAEAAIKETEGKKP